MATFNNGESGLSVRTKLNNVMQHADGTPSTLTINEAGADVDVRMESLGQPNAFFLDGGTANIGIGTANATSKLTIIGDANVAGVATAVATRDSTNRRIANPGGGSYTTTSSSVTGAIAITLPVGYTSHMMRTTIKVYDYVTHESFDVVVTGYNASSGPTWLNCSAYIIGSNAADLNYTVRFGFNSTSSRCVLYIGELTTVWAYPQINVVDVQLGFTTSGLDAWDTDWSIGFEASAFQNVTVTLSNIRVGSRLTGAGQTTAALTDAGARSDLLRLSSVGSASGTGGGIVFTNSQADAANSLGMAAIKSLLADGSSNTRGDLAFSTRNATTDTALTERMRLTSGGSLAVGHASPQSDTRLDVLGNAIIRAGTTENSFLEVGRGRTGDGPTFIDLVGDTTYADYGLRIIRNGGANGNTQFINRGTGSIDITTQDAGPLRLLTTNTERARISAGGNFGIGTNNPVYRLDVAGSARFQDGIEAGNLQGLKDYNWLVDTGADLANTWRKIVDVTCQNTQYSTVGFKFDVIDMNSNNPGTSTADSIDVETYYVACVRANDTVLDTPDACYVRGPSDRIRAVKTGVGTYEIQLQNEAQYREYRINSQIYGVNGGHTIVYQNNTTANTGIAQYNATTSGGIREHMMNPIVKGNVAIRTGNSFVVPTVALQVGVPDTTSGALRANATFVSVDAGYSAANIFGTAALPSLVIGGDLNTGVFHPAADTLALSTNGTERLRVTSTGLVSITNGSLGRGGVVTKTTSFTLADSEDWIICNGTATIVVTFPAASAWTGREVMIKNIAAFAVDSASTNIVPINSATAGTSILPATAGTWATLVSDGTNWVIMQS